MGFKKPLDYHSVKSQIERTAGEINSRYNDGFLQFELKKDLYRLKWLLDEILKDACEFSGEEEFIAEHSKKKMWKLLKK